MDVKKIRHKKCHSLLAFEINCELHQNYCVCFDQNHSTMHTYSLVRVRSKFLKSSLDLDCQKTSKKVVKIAGTYLKGLANINMASSGGHSNIQL